MAALAYSTLDLLERLPATRGKLRAGADLSKSTWFQVGGQAEVLFRPEDTEDLAYFLTCKPDDVAVTVLGVGSNLLVRDGGIDGVTIRLGAGFNQCRAQEDRIWVGAGCLNSALTRFAQGEGIGGLEFLSGVPGSIGGALAMNAGAYGAEMRDILVEAEAIDSAGNTHTLSVADFQYSYRHCGLPGDWIFTRALLQGVMTPEAQIAERMAAIAESRSATQPIRSRTGGSTFKNPEGHKAWQLIEAAGCRGMRIGDAQISEMHCNFMINNGNATAHDLEQLGETVRQKVADHSGIMLEWEIKRMGIPARAYA